MAKNFTDFQLVSGSYTPPLTADGATPGVTDTQATSGMYLVGYDTDTPGGERRYTIESVLLAAGPQHVGLENVTNESKSYMFNNSMFTGSTSAQNMTVLGDLVVEGDNVTMNTTIASTSALKVSSSSPDSAVIALEIEQNGPGAIARFLDGEDLALDIGSNGNVGIGVQASNDTALTISGDVSAGGDVFVQGNINGRDISQDGVKIDNFGPYADMTALNLDNVAARLTWLKNNVTDYADIDTGKGLDVLEDGDQFKKTPALMSVGGTGVGDYSVEKLATVEKNADVTRDHSGDIIFNQIPDGPNTGDKNTTYVKITSGASERLDSVRGVNISLYAGDDEQDITALHIASAYHDAYPDFWSSANESEYRDTIIPTINDLHAAVTPSSGDWNSSSARVIEMDDEWTQTYTVTRDYSARWWAGYTTTFQHSGNWQDTYTRVDQSGDSWDTTATQVAASADDWNETTDTMRNEMLSLYTHVTGASAKWHASVNNTPALDGSPRELPAGEAELEYVNISESLTAQSEVRLGGSVFVLSAGEWKPGVTNTIQLGQDKLVFVDGILVDWQQ